MNKKVILGAVIAILIRGGGAFAFFGMNKEDAVAPAVTASSTESTEASTDTLDTDSAMTKEAESTATITFTDSGFTPNKLTVKKGTVVTVKNTSSKSVQFSSDDHPTHREDPEINLKTLAAGESATFTAQTVGTHGYHDHINDELVGTLVVTE